MISSIAWFQPEYTTTKYLSSTSFEEVVNTPKLTIDGAVKDLPGKRDGMSPSPPAAFSTASVRVRHDDCKVPWQRVSRELYSALSNYHHLDHCLPPRTSHAHHPASTARRSVILPPIPLTYKEIVFHMIIALLHLYVRY